MPASAGLEREVKEIPQPPDLNALHIPKVLDVTSVTRPGPYIQASFQVTSILRHRFLFQTIPTALLSANRIWLCRSFRKASLSSLPSSSNLVPHLWLHPLSSHSFLVPLAESLDTAYRHNAPQKRQAKSLRRISSCSFPPRLGATISSGSSSSRASREDTATTKSHTTYGSLRPETSPFPPNHR